GARRRQENRSGWPFEVTPVRTPKEFETPDRDELVALIRVRAARLAFRAIRRRIGRSRTQRASSFEHEHDYEQKHESNRKLAIGIRKSIFAPCGFSSLVAADSSCRILSNSCSLSVTAWRFLVTSTIFTIRKSSSPT